MKMKYEKNRKYPFTWNAIRLPQVYALDLDKRGQVSRSLESFFKVMAANIKFLGRRESPMFRDHYISRYYTPIGYVLKATIVVAFFASFYAPFAVFAYWLSGGGSFVLPASMRIIPLTIEMIFSKPLKSYINHFVNPLVRTDSNISMIISRLFSKSPLLNYIWGTTLGQLFVTLFYPWPANATLKEGMLWGGTYIFRLPLAIVVAVVMAVVNTVKLMQLLLATVLTTVMLNLYSLPLLLMDGIKASYTGLLSGLSWFKSHMPGRADNNVEFVADKSILGTKIDHTNSIDIVDDHLIQGGSKSKELTFEQAVSGIEVPTISEGLMKAYQSGERRAFQVAMATNNSPDTTKAQIRYYNFLLKQAVNQYQLRHDFVGEHPLSMPYIWQKGLDSTIPGCDQLVMEVVLGIKKASTALREIELALDTHFGFNDNKLRKLQDMHKYEQLVETAVAEQQKSIKPGGPS